MVTVVSLVPSLKNRGSPIPTANKMKLSESSILVSPVMVTDTIRFSRSGGKRNDTGGREKSSASAVMRADWSRIVYVCSEGRDLVMTRSN